MRLATSVLVLLLVGGASTASAQAGWGVKGGVNFANLHFEDADDDVNMDNRIGFVGGVFITLPAGAHFDVQPEFLYSQKGSSIDELGVSAKTKIDYAEIPILFRYRSAPVNQSAFVLFGGPSMGFKVSAKATAEFDGQTESEDIDEFVESFDFGIVFGAGFETGRFVLDGRYTWGLSNLNKDETDPTNVKNRVISLMAGVRF
jgi:opacity protein-like surface antigen